MGRLMALMGVGLIVGTASAQVVTPPPGPPAQKPEYVRPEIAPRVAPEIKAQPKRPDISSIEYDSIAVLGDDSKIIRLAEPADLAALKANPLIGPEQLETLQPWMAARRVSMETLVIDNVDAAIEIDLGIIDEIYSNEQEQFQVIVDLIRPLSITTGLGDDLRKAELVSPEQGAMIDEISREYRGKVIDEIQQSFVAEPGDESTGVDYILRYVFTENAQEPMYAYYALLIESAPQVGGWLDDLGVAEAEASAINAVLASYEAGMGDEQTLVLMRKVVDQLETAQVRSMFEMVIAARGE